MRDRNSTTWLLLLTLAVRFCAVGGLNAVARGGKSASASGSGSSSGSGWTPSVPPDVSTTTTSSAPTQPRTTNVFTSASTTTTHTLTRIGSITPTRVTPAVSRAGSVSTTTYSRTTSSPEIGANTTLPAQNETTSITPTMPLDASTTLSRTVSVTSTQITPSTNHQEDPYTQRPTSTSLLRQQFGSSSMPASTQTTYPGLGGSTSNPGWTSTTTSTTIVFEFHVSYTERDHDAMFSGTVVAGSLIATIVIAVGVAVGFFFRARWAAAYSSIEGSEYAPVSSRGAFGPRGGRTASASSQDTELADYRLASISDEPSPRQSTHIKSGSAQSSNWWTTPPSAQPTNAAYFNAAFVDDGPVPRSPDLDV